MKPGMLIEADAGERTKKKNGKTPSAKSLTGSVALRCESFSST
jgi:hypothetical protein